MNDLELYYRPSCPYCSKVLNFMKDNNIEITLHNLDTASDLKNKLIEIGGKGQIPCLIANGKPVYESEDIINWLKDNKVNV